MLFNPRKVDSLDKIADSDDAIRGNRSAVEFGEEIGGIVGIGTGRNYGMGIFANLPSSVAV